MKIYWSLKAEKDFSNILDYLSKNWSNQVANEYVSKVNDVLNILKSKPRMGMFDSNVNAYKILVVKQIYLIYKIEGYDLRVISFWDNRQKPLF